MTDRRRPPAALAALPPLFPAGTPPRTWRPPALLGIMMQPVEARQAAETGVGLAATGAIGLTPPQSIVL